MFDGKIKSGIFWEYHMNFSLGIFQEVWEIFNKYSTSDAEA